MKTRDLGRILHTYRAAGGLYVVAQIVLLQPAPPPWQSQAATYVSIVIDTIILCNEARPVENEGSVHRPVLA